MAASKCAFCGGKATLLCDSHLGWERMRSQMAVECPNLREGPGYEVPLKYRISHTCDAPLCRACAVNAGSMHFRLRNIGAFSDTTDYCPGHGWGDMRTEITGLQADAERAQWRKAARGQLDRANDNEQMGLFTGLL